MSGKPVYTWPNQVSNMHRNLMPGIYMVRVKKPQKKEKKERTV